jgi:hypothetical protein
MLQQVIRAARSAVCFSPTRVQTLKYTHFLLCHVCHTCDLWLVMYTQGHSDSLWFYVPASLAARVQLAYAHPYPEESWMPSSRPEVLLGVVASEGRLAVRALRDWCLALGLQYVTPDCKASAVVVFDHQPPVSFQLGEQSQLRRCFIAHHPSCHGFVILCPSS